MILNYAVAFILVVLHLYSVVVIPASLMPIKFNKSLCYLGPFRTPHTLYLTDSWSHSFKYQLLLCEPFDSTNLALHFYDLFGSVEAHWRFYSDIVVIERVSDLFLRGVFVVMGVTTF